MWWLLALPVAGAIAAAVGALTAESPVSPEPKTKRSGPTSHPQSGHFERILTANLNRLRKELCSSPGRKVALLGQPGAGKSTTLDALTEERVQPRPRIGIGTDMTDWSRNPDVPLCSFFEDILFVDAPGHGTQRHSTEVYLRLFPLEQFEHVLLFIQGKLLESDERLLRYARSRGRRITIVRTHAGGLTDAERELLRADLSRRSGVPAEGVLFLDNRTREGLNALRR
ncbi:GTPase domain-containing protein [Deinococcus sp. MIMF12]|uniref:GTPase domain-containing protein n=1 Tax=Deinococcus rhizophilus TaxID=3049544 RepID=A0ABT7JJV3_9DEIO|nr:GTPase domain-containing protein [Deinococcus rhizophilus]MDL2344228.1 GTPase domain-containing protein [Deinococcus rhizophilus]